MNVAGQSSKGRVVARVRGMAARAGRAGWLRCFWWPKPRPPPPRCLAEETRSANGKGSTGRSRTKAASINSGRDG